MTVEFYDPYILGGSGPNNGSGYRVLTPSFCLCYGSGSVLDGAKMWVNMSKQSAEKYCQHKRKFNRYKNCYVNNHRAPGFYCKCGKQYSCDLSMTKRLLTDFFAQQDNCLPHIVSSIVGYIKYRSKYGCRCRDWPDYCQPLYQKEEYTEICIEVYPKNTYKRLITARSYE